MTVMIAEVFDALKSAGAEEEKARLAAEAAAETRGELQRLSTDLRSEMQALATELRGEMHALRSEMHSLPGEVQSVRGEMTTVKWMIGVLIAIVIAIFLQGLFG